MFGNTLRARREELGISQYRLAELAGMRQPDISRIESGTRRHLNLATLQRLADPLRLRLALVPDEYAGLHKGCSTCGAPTEGTADFCPDHTPDGLFS